MDHPRHQFLAGSGLAGNVHRRLAAGDPSDHVTELVDGRRVSQQTSLAVASVTGGKPERVADDVAQVGEIERFGNEVEGARFQRADRRFHVAVRGDDRDRGAQALGLHPVHQVQAVAVGQAHVGQT